MLLHLVSFKYKADVDAATRAQHRQRLGALRDLDVVGDLKVGEDVVHAARSYDTGLAITFRDRAALDAYQTHERHVAVVQFGAGLCAHVVAVDFEI
jgi:stress responsive alpha/beta barrel protein